MAAAIDWLPRLRHAAIDVTSLVVPVPLAWALGGSLAAFGVGIGTAMPVASVAAAGLPAARLGAPAIRGRREHALARWVQRDRLHLWLGARGADERARRATSA